MRSIESIESAKAALSSKKTTTAVSSLPPGYYQGFRIYTQDYQLIIGKGVMNCRGTAVYHRSERVVDGSEYLDPDELITGFTYYIYMNKAKEVLVDVVDGIYDDTNFGFYHPSLYQYRLLGQFTLVRDADGHWTYTDIVTQDPVLGSDIIADSIVARHLTTGSVGTTKIADDSISTAKLQADSIVAAKIAAEAVEAEHLSATTLETLLLKATRVIIGFKSFSGTTSYAAPGEGDTRVYVENYYIGYEEYTNGGWVVAANGLKIGALISSIFLNMVGCGGLYHPANQPTNAEQLPHPDFRVFNFENNYQDQNGVDDWAAKTDCAFDSTVKKFGSYSMWAADTKVSLLTSPAGGTMGNSQTAAAWYYISTTGTASGNNAKITEMFMIHETSNTIAVGVRVPNGETVAELVVYVMKNGSIVLDSTYICDVQDSTWMLIGISYNSTDDRLKIVVNNVIYDMGVLGGSWDTGTFNYVRPRSARGYVADSVTFNARVDELLFYWDKLLSPELLAQHYTHNVAWATAYSKADILIGPDTDGRAYIDGGLHVTGEFTGSSWLSFTPTITNLSVGNGTVVAAYKRIGKTVVFRVSVVFGSTTSISGVLILSLPVTIRGGVGNPRIGTAVFNDVGSSVNHAGVVNAFGAIRALVVSGSAVVEAALSATVPFTWASTDQLFLTGMYESA